MAKILDSFTFARGGNGGGHGKHPWQFYLDGRIHQLDASEGGDLFNASIRTFVALLHRQAKRMGKKVHVAIDKAAQTVTLQAYIPEQQPSDADGEQPQPQPDTTATEQPKQKRGRGKRGKS